MARAWVFPGQGSQHQGMGEDLFDRFPDLTATADGIIGVPVRRLCRDEGKEFLRQTRYVQPAVFVVSALAALAAADDGEPPPDVMAGHSLGEYAALFAAGCVDFATGLRMVVHRGELMGRFTGGGMVAVLGLPIERVTAIIDEAGGGEVDVANHNLPDQLVLSGRQTAIRAVINAVIRGGEGKCVPLNVSIAAHSRYLADAADAFAEFLRGITFAAPRVPVLSNVTAQPHGLAALPDLLCRHFVRPVRWWDTMCHLSRTGVTELREVGPGEVLRKMWARAGDRLPGPVETPTRVEPPAPDPGATAETAAPTPASEATAETAAPAPVPGVNRAPSRAPMPAPVVAPERLGSAEFRAEYGVRYAYLVGAADGGVTSVATLRRLSDAGLLGFHGTAGLGLDAVRAALRDLAGVARFGMGWPSGSGDDAERRLVDLYLGNGIRHVEVGPLQAVTRQLLRFRFAGGPRHVLARVGDPAAAARFLRPPDSALLGRLVLDGDLSPAEAAAAARLPVATDLAVDGGHDLLPAITALRDDIDDRVRVGAAGGLGTPAAVAAAFVLGADFVVTTSINQCTPQAGTSDEAKALLADLDVPDIRPAPVAELFDLGARVPVARKGTLFAARAEQLYQLYLRHDRVEDIDPATRAAIERTHFGRPLDQVWTELGTEARDAKHRMALVFASYCREATAAALRGIPGQRLNFRVPCGPDMGAFNRFAAGGALAEWRGRHVDLMAEELVHGAANRLHRALAPPEHASTVRRSRG